MSRMQPVNYLSSLTNKGIVTHGDENEQNHAQIKAKLFRQSLKVSQDNKDVPVVQRSVGRSVIVLMLSQLYCLQIQFFEKEEATNFTT